MRSSPLVWILSFLVIFLVCRTPRSSLAAKIFVAGNDAKPDDKNPGTKALPFAATASIQIVPNVPVWSDD